MADSSDPDLTAVNASAPDGAEQASTGGKASPAGAYDCMLEWFTDRFPSDQGTSCTGDTAHPV